MPAPKKKASGVRTSIRFDPPSLEEAIFAAQGLTDIVDDQAAIAASLMGLPEADVKAAILRSQTRQDPDLSPPVRPSAIYAASGTGRGRAQSASHSDALRARPVRSIPPNHSPGFGSSYRDAGCRRRFQRSDRGSGAASASRFARLRSIASGDGGIETSSIDGSGTRSGRDIASGCIICSTTPGLLFRDIRSFFELLPSTACPLWMGAVSSPASAMPACATASAANGTAECPSDEAKVRSSSICSRLSCSGEGSRPTGSTGSVLPQTGLTMLCRMRGAGARSAGA